LKGEFPLKRLLIASIAAGAFLAGPAIAQQWDHPPDEPAGYGDYYHENTQSPDLPARWGYRAGFDDGASDAAKGHSYRPTEDDHFKKVPEIPMTGMSRQQIKDRYREAYVHGYERGFGPHHS
jgi:hypothetical protein